MRKYFAVFFVFAATHLCHAARQEKKPPAKRNFRKMFDLSKELLQSCNGANEGKE